MVKKEGKLNSKSMSADEKKALKKDLQHYGYLLPTNEEELEEFEKIYGTTQVIFPEHLKNPDFLFTKEKITKTSNKISTTIKGAVKKVKVPKNDGKKVKGDYFKKMVLAAEIANQLHQENTFGHVKFVKILFLCQEIGKMKLSTNYGKYAAGPLDPKFMYSVDREFKKQKWFSVTKTEYGYRYTPDENIEKYKEYFSRNFSYQEESINRIISLLKKAKTDFCEIVATLFAVWKENLEKNVLINDATLIHGFYSWHPDKNKYSESALTTAIRWMNENDVVPVK